MPDARHLRDAALHRQTATASVAAAGTGIAKGVYRFATHEEAGVQRLDALVRVVACEAARMRR